LGSTQSFGNLAASAVIGILYTVASPSVAFAHAATMMVLALQVIVGTPRGA
jgi:hypothetical protein